MIWLIILSILRRQSKFQMFLKYFKNETKWTVKLLLSLNRERVVFLRKTKSNYKGKTPLSGAMLNKRRIFSVH